LITDRRRFPAPLPGEVFAAAEWRVLQAAIRAGVGALQLREKDLEGGELYDRAAALVGLCREAGVKFLVNDRADVALAAGADGVHLPGNGLPVVAARELLGARALVGRSMHDPGELAAAAGADFVLFGPVFDTPSKRRFGPPQGVARLAAVARRSSMPVLAVGGVTPERVAEVLSAGAAGVAVIGSVLDAEDPVRAVADLTAALYCHGARC
jgi:thiamine-phosphate pyrophosphorylase